MNREDERLSASQFDALAYLLRLRASPAREGARLVLVEGMRQVDAASSLGISRQQISDAIRRCRRGIQLAREVCGLSGA